MRGSHRNLNSTPSINLINLISHTRIHDLDARINELARIQLLSECTERQKNRE